MGIVRTACIQMRSGVDEAENIDTLDWMVREAARDGALYVQTPEMTGVLQMDADKLNDSISPDDHNPVFNACSQLAKDLGIWLHLGSTAVKLDDGKTANRSALFSPLGKRVATYDKIHMFDVDLGEGNRWRESSRFAAGDQSLVVDIGGFQLGMSICYDLRFPQIYRQQAKNGAVVLTCPSSFTKPTGEAHWEILLRARAIENGAFMIAAAQGGVHEDGRETYGHSMIIDPWGEVLGKLSHNDPGILIADIDLEIVKEVRVKVPSLANEKKFSISRVNTAGTGVTGA